MFLLRSLTSFFKHAPSRAVGLIFSADGLLYGSWSALIPYIKTKFGLDAAELGALLFCLPMGVTVANLLGAWLIRHYGMRRTTILSLFITAPCFILPLLVPNLILLAFNLFICGLFFSILNVAMNTCATALENKEGIRILSTCHGMWSLGAMLGSALGGMITGWGVAPALYMSGAVVGILLVGIGVRASILAIPEEKVATQSENASFVWPTRLLWGLIVLSLCTNLAEGTMADWAAVYMRDIVQTAPWLTGWGFAAYAFWMATGRFTGDELTHRYGSRRALQVGGAVVAGGFILAVALPYTFTTLLGFALVGAGVSLGAPVLYGSASRVPGLAPGVGLATMNTFAMAGFLAGPAFIGFLAKALGLREAFLLVAGVALFWCWKAGRAKGLT